MIRNHMEDILNKCDIYAEDVSEFNYKTFIWKIDRILWKRLQNYVRSIEVVMIIAVDESY